MSLLIIIFSKVQQIKENGKSMVWVKNQFWNCLKYFYWHNVGIFPIGIRKGGVMHGFHFIDVAGRVRGYSRYSCVVRVHEYHDIVSLFVEALRERFQTTFGAFGRLLAGNKERFPFIKKGVMLLLTKSLTLISLLQSPSLKVLFSSIKLIS